MKTIYTLVIALFISNLSLFSQTKVATVDSDYILGKMPQLKTVQERLQKYGARLDSINNLKIKDYESKAKAYNAEIDSLSEAAKKIRLNEINLINQDIAKFRQNGSQMMQIRRDEFLRPLYQKITETVKEIAKEKGYTQVLTTSGNEFAYFDENHDITKMVLNKLGIKEEE